MMIQKREFYIYKKMMDHYEYIKKNHPELHKNIIYWGLQGSQNYNLDMYTDEYISDIDTKAIYVPTLREIAANKTPISTTIVTDDDEHIDVKDIRLMFQNFKKQNINFLEILFTDFVMSDPRYDDEIKELRDNAEKIAHFNVNQALRCMSGMSMEKLNAIEHPYPAKIHLIEKYGYDGKQLHHIIRMNAFIKEYVKGTSFKDALTKWDSVQGMMWKAKLNQYTLQEARDLARDIDSETKAIKDQNVTEEDKIDKEVEQFLEDFIYRILRKNILNEVLEEEKI